MTALLLLLCIGADAGSFRESLQDEALKATVRTAAFHDNTVGTGTGTIVARDGGDLIVLTAAHVIPNATRYEVTFWPFTPGAPVVDDITVIASSRPADVCLLRVQTQLDPPAILPICRANVIPKLTFPVFTIGCSNGEAPSLEFASALDVKEISHEAGNGRFWVLDREPVPGRSGGAMVAPHGAVVGVCLGYGPGQGFYAHVREIYKLCDAANLTSLYQDQATAREVSFAATIDTARAPQWIDPAHWKAKATLKLQLQLQTADDLPFIAPINFELRSAPDIDLDANGRSISVGKPGTHEHVFELSLSMSAAVAFKITVQPTEIPSNVQLSPSTVIIPVHLTPPSKVVTIIRATQTNASPAQWVNLRDGLATFDAKVRIDVDGPLGDRSVLALQSPVGVRSIKLSNSVLRTGHQDLRISGTAVMNPGPKSNEFHFTFNGQNQGAIDVQMGAPLRLAFLGPNPAKLAMSQGGVVRDKLITPSTSDASRVRIAFKPVVVQTPARRMNENIDVVLKSSPNLLLSGPRQFAVLHDAILDLEPDATMDRSFFRDTVIEGNVTIRPASATPALVGSTHSVALKAEAPFKRMLTAIIGAICVIVLISLPYRFFCHLNNADTEGPNS